MIEKITVDETFEERPASWLHEKAEKYRLAYLLAHADDGVIWGRLGAGGTLVLSGDAFKEVKVELRGKTLQQARLFGPRGELLVWRTEAGFDARLILDGPLLRTALEETQWLWGRGLKTFNGFTLMSEGRQGLLHAVPVKNKLEKRLGLRVRHYIECDDHGQSFIALSRLVCFKRVLDNWPESRRR